MAFQDLRKGRDTASTSTTSAGGVGSLTAFIDQGSEFSGKLSFKDTVRIDGKFEGEIASENTLIVGESGAVHATIRSEIVVVHGEVVGDILANQQVALHKTAKVTGNVTTKVFTVEEGAEMNGRIDMSGGSKSSAAPAPKESKPGNPNNADSKGPDDDGNVVKMKK